MSLSEQAVKAQVRIYVRVFFALAALTVVTVGVSHLQFPFRVALAVALAIAAVKSSLVAAFFMHLSHEKRVIFWILLAAVFAFLLLLFLPIWSHQPHV